MLIVSLKSMIQCLYKAITKINRFDNCLHSFHFRPLRHQFQNSFILYPSCFVSLSPRGKCFVFFQKFKKVSKEQYVEEKGESRDLTLQYTICYPIYVVKSMMIGKCFGIVFKYGHSVALAFGHIG